MRVFEDFRIEWDGEEIVIPSNRVMGLIHTVETIIPPLKLTTMMVELAEDPTSIKPALISKVLSAVLRYGGKSVSEEDVYNGIFGKGDRAYAMAITIAALVEGIIPESLKREMTKDAIPPGKPNRQTRRAKASQSPRSKSPAASQKMAG